MLKATEPAAAFPGGHCTAQLVCLAAGKACRNDGKLHHLLLENGYAERALEHLLYRGARIGNRLLAVTPAQIGMHHVTLDRAGADDCHLDNQIVKTARSEARQHGHLCTGFDLEYNNRIAPADHRIHIRVFGRHCRHAQLTTVPSTQQLETTLDDRQHSKRENIYFEQAKIVKVILVPLNNGAAFHRRILDRHQPVERLFRNKETAYMLREMARKPVYLTN